MPKALCWAGLVIAILVLGLFLFDLVAPATMAPFQKSSIWLDIVFILSAGALAYLSWTTLKEQDKREPVETAFITTWRDVPCKDEKDQKDIKD